MILIRKNQNDFIVFLFEFRLTSVPDKVSGGIVSFCFLKGRKPHRDDEQAFALSGLTY